MFNFDGKIYIQLLIWNYGWVIFVNIVVSQVIDSNEQVLVFVNIYNLIGVFGGDIVYLECIVVVLNSGSGLQIDQICIMYDLNFIGNVFIDGV